MGKVYVLGDTHSCLDNLLTLRAEQTGVHSFTKEDYVIITGDFGFVWYTDKNSTLYKDKEKTLDIINEMPFTTLFCLGNHENYTRIKSYPVVKWHGGRVRKIRKSVLCLMNGEVYNINGKKFFVFGGGESVDKAYREPYKTWWPEEIPSQEEYNKAIKNLKSIDWAPDYIITHVMPDSYVREFYGSRYHPGDKAAYMCNDFLIRCHGYTKWYCGHYHVDAAMRPDFQICYKKVYEVM